MEPFPIGALETQIPGGFATAGARHCDYRQVMDRIVGTYDSPIIRTYCKVRFSIININILDILLLCLRGKSKILDVGCGFGLFGCFLSTVYPNISYLGIDVDAERIALASQVAARLGLKNAQFICSDARALRPVETYDAIMMVDLLHHLEDNAKRQLLETCAGHLRPDGRLVIKDVTRHPFPKIAFTWFLDLLMTRSTAMWYWGEQDFHNLLDGHFELVDTFPISDPLPFPHIVYLGERTR